MSKLLGVKANVSFGAYRIGRVYEVDLEDQTVLSLLGVGYFTPVDEDGDADKDGDANGEDEDGQVDPSGRVRGVPAVRSLPVVGSPRSLEEVNVDDPFESGGSAAKRKASSVRGGKAFDGTGASGGTGPGSEGDA